MLSTKKTKKTKKTLRNLIPNLLPYPFYKNAYKLNIAHIKQLALTQNLRITSKPLNNAKYRYPLKPLILKTTNKLTSKPIPKITIIQASWHQTEELNSLTDYFSEQCRIQCHFKNNQSPLEFWNTHQSQLLAKLPPSPTITDIRELIYNSIRLCNNFRIPVALTIIKMFKATKWLDISAGWGDRLLSALLSPSIEFYCGADPNACLHPHYAEMIATFRPPSQRKNFVLIEDGFIEAKLPLGITYDFILSSPPFFDLEAYSNSPNNSLVKNPTADQWFSNFLIPALAKSISYLEPNGHLVLYMGDSNNTNYMGAMIKFLNSLLSSRGAIYYQDGKTIRELLVFSKV